MAIVLCAGVVACGSDGGEAPPDSGNTGGGWVTITSPALSSPITDYLEISVSGEAFIRDYQGHYTSTDAATATGVTVMWTNSTTGQSGATTQRVSVCWNFLFRDYLCHHSWSAEIPLAMGNNVFRITASDNVGGVGNASMTVLRIPDTTPPTVRYMNPTDGSTGIPVDGIVTANFSEPMDPATINTGTFLLTGPGGLLIPGIVALAKDYASFSLINDLASGTQYTATITTGAKDLAGNNSLARNVSWSFTTGSNFWLPMSTIGAPRLEFGYSTIWSGSDVIFWGLNLSGNSDGRRYNPGSDTWQTISLIGAPSLRGSARAVWTGTEMIVWGGFNSILGHLNDGALYNPNTDTWRPMSTIGAPGPLTSAKYSVIWTGSEMIVWGGTTSSPPSTLVNTGAGYNPATDTWRPLSIIDAPSGRQDHSAVWTGTRMIVWGGLDETANWTNTGGIYNPVTDSWQPMAVTGAPVSRQDHSAIWTGTTMVIWGGRTGVANSRLNSGGRYDLATDTWLPTTTSGAPSGRISPLTVWTGAEMLVWGGLGSSGWTATGGRYDPVANQWSTISNTGAPTETTDQAVWTGSSMAVWGLTQGAKFFP